MIKKGLAILFAIAIIMAPMTVQAKTVTRYATKTVELKEQSSSTSKTMYKVKMKTRLAVTAQGKTWATISYKGATVYAKKAELHKTKAVNKYPGRKFKRVGRGRWNKFTWTYYSQRILPGRGLKIPGRHVDSRGFVCDKDGYICLGSGMKNKKNKVIVPTPFGKYGKVYDTNGGNNNRWFDTYVNW